MGRPPDSASHVYRHEDLILLSATTGSWPRPRWFDVSMWGSPFDTCMMDVRFGGKYQDAMAVVTSGEERAVEEATCLLIRRLP